MLKQMEQTLRDSVQVECTEKALDQTHIHAGNHWIELSWFLYPPKPHTAARCIKATSKSVQNDWNQEHLGKNPLVINYNTGVQYYYLTFLRFTNISSKSSITHSNLKNAPQHTLEKKITHTSLDTRKTPQKCAIHKITRQLTHKLGRSYFKSASSAEPARERTDAEPKTLQQPHIYIYYSTRR